MDNIQFIVHRAYAVDNIWSVIFRAVIWFGVSLVIIFSLSNPDMKKTEKILKSNLGFFLMFLLLSGSLIYLLFGFTTIK